MGLSEKKLKYLLIKQKKCYIFAAEFKNMRKLLLSLCIALATISYGQDAKTVPAKEKTTLYSFQIDNATSTEKLNTCATEALQVKGVTEAKIRHKPEKKVAELLLVVTEKERKSEGEEEFQLTEIKKIIIRNGFSPAGFVILN